MDGIFPLFPYLLIYRTEEVEGSNPARSTGIPPQVGEILVAYVHICGLTGLCYQIVNQLSNIVLRIKKIITINILHVRF
jgi:hypothetical protein